jgi:hypothetical protein
VIEMLEGVVPDDELFGWIWTINEVGAWCLPAVGDVEGSREMYIRTWRPRTSHPQTWGGRYAQEVVELDGGHAGGV